MRHARKLQGTSRRTAALLLAAGSLACLSACASEPINTPAVVGLNTSQRDPIEDLDARISADPTDIAAYAEKIRRLIDARRYREIPAVLEQMLDVNETDHRAWLVAADLARTAQDYVLTEERLFNAHNLAPDAPETNQALATFYRDVDLPTSESLYWGFYLEAISENAAERERAHIALANAYWRDGTFELAREQLAGLDPAGDAYATLALRFALADGDTDAAIALIESSEDLTPISCALLLRLTPFAQSIAELERIEQLARKALEQLEAPEARLAALMTLWQASFATLLLGDAAEPEASAAILPAGMREVAARIDQIDARQRDWVLRRWMVASVSRGIDAKAELEEAQARLTQLGLPAPPKPSSVREVLLAWQVEDGMRLRVESRTNEALTALSERRPEDSALTLVRAQIALEYRRFARAAELLADKALLANASLDRRRIPLEWYALIGSGKPKQVIEELRAALDEQNQARAPSRPYPALGTEVFRIQALAYYHAHRLGIAVKPLHEE